MWAATGDVRLPDAVMRGDVDAIRSLLQQKVDVNAAQGDGMTALHWAVYRDDLDTARMLIKSGADLTAKTRVAAITPLYLAASNGNVAMIEALLSAGADANLANDLGTTPLMQASAAGSVEAVKLLLEHGAMVNAKETARQQTALMFAAALNRVPVITLLASRGAELNVTSKIVAIDKNLVDEDGNPVPAPSRTGTTKEVPRSEGQVKGTGGMTALLYASRDGLIDAVKALVEAGANVNRVNPIDKTSPMVIAINSGHYDVAKYLLDHGADPNLASIDGLAPLYAVLENRWAPVAWTPTTATAANGVVQQKTTHLELMKALLEKGADRNAKVLRTIWFNPPHHNQLWTKVDGTTAFWRAAQANDVAAMKLLVEYGADPKIPSAKHVSPLAVASGIGWTGNYSTTAPDGPFAAAKYLTEELGLDVNAADDEGFTPLMGAAWRGDNALVQYFVGKGAKLDARNARGWAVTDMANGPSLHSSVPVKYPETIALLEKLGAPAPVNYSDDEEILGIIKRNVDPETGKFIKAPEGAQKKRP